MKVRGTRQCKSCSRTWSYFETGSVACPDCGSLRSVGVDDSRLEHTDAPVALDLEPIRRRLADESIEAVESALAVRLRTDTRKRGFINGGALRPLDRRYLNARELRYALDLFVRRRDTTDVERLYLFDLLDATIDGERLPTDEVPPGMKLARGAGYTDALVAYRRDLSTWYDDSGDSETAAVLESLRDHLNRAEALDGAISIATAETLVSIVDDLYAYLTGDEKARARTDDEARPRTVDEEHHPTDDTDRLESARKKLRRLA